MRAFLASLFEPSTFTPHGFCLWWDPGLIWLHAGSDLVIGLAYFSIPIVLLSFVRRRPDVEFGWLVWLFALFILACGATHFLSIATLWVPVYRLEGIVKLVTAMASVGTAVLLWPLLPRLLALPSPAALRQANEALAEQIAHRDHNAAVLREREAQLRQLQKMEALGQLAGGIAHDFNNVLQAVSGGLSLIRRRATDSAAVIKLADMTGNAAARGASITGRLLAFARKGELQAEPVPPGALLEGLREMLDHTLGAAIEVRTEVAPDTPDLLADRAQLETMLVNLAVNARDAMPGGGLLLLSARAERVASRQAHAAALEPGAYVRITLADSGRGMAPEVLARAGEPFFTTKPVGEGTGLGLAMVRGFARQSGGALQIDSTPGQGTSVALWLPAATAAAAEAPAPAAAAHDCSRHRRILLVDDDDMVRTMLVQTLTDRGYEVLAVADGLSALALLDGEEAGAGGPGAGAGIALLVSDYAMPGMNGLDLLGQVRRRQPRLPVLLLTGFADAQVLARVDADGDAALQMLRKPVAADLLAARIAAMLDATMLDAADG